MYCIYIWPTNTIYRLSDRDICPSILLMILLLVLLMILFMILRMILLVTLLIFLPLFLSYWSIRYKNGLKILYCIEWFTIMTCIDLINCRKEVLISIFFFLRLQLTAKILNTIHDTTQDCTYHFLINLEPNTILFSTKSIGKWWIQSDTIWGRGMN